MGQAAGMNGEPLPPIVVVLPDGQELRGLVHTRVRTQRSVMYQVGLPMWQSTAEEWVEPAEYVMWVPDAYVRPVEGVLYDDVSTRHPAPEPAPAPVVEAGESRLAWRIERLPRERGRPGWSVVHVHDCEDADDGDVLDIEQALLVLQSPGTRVCTKCGAANALPPLM